jgi:hypothetical protein
MLSTTLMRTEQKRRTLGISSSTISRLAGLRGSAMSEAMREVTRLSSEQEAKLELVVSQLTALDASVRPFRLPLDSAELNDLQMILDGGISPEKLQDAITSLFQQHQ